MPSSMTYDLLVTDVQTYVERDDSPFVDQIPRFIMLAENRIASEIRGLGLRRYANGAISAANPIVAKPARWRETFSFVINTSVGKAFLYPRSYEYCRVLWPDIAVTGTPRYYADYDYEHFFIVAPPAANTTFEIGYHERPEPLSPSNQTNWTTQYAPQLLLYATLLEAQPFLKRPERIAEFQGLYDRAAQGIGKEDAMRLMDAAVNRGG